MNDLKFNIQNSILSFKDGNLFNNSISLFNTLGYNTARQNRLDGNSFDDFKNNFINSDDNFNEEKALVKEWNKIELLFQLTNEEVTGLTDMFSSGKVDNTIIESYLFFAVELSGQNYSRTKLSSITREINKLFSMPVMVLFFYDEKLTLSIINRRLHKRDTSKDVLEKVTLIKDVRIENPHRAHIEILYDLSFPALVDKHKVSSFVELHKAWEKVLDTKELNKKFFRELSNWYFWAVNETEFPDGAEKERAKRNPISVIRLITRLMFVWFIKEKKLVSDKLFDKSFLDTILKYNDITDSTYYKAILQNLFFATLNTDMNKDKPESRKFINGQHLVHNLYRYGDLFNDKTEAIKLFENIPFLNGGLFECLDRKDDNDNVIRIDCFSENPKNRKRLKVPDYLFFGEEQIVDLSEIYGNKKKNKEKVRPIIDILNSYKFTIDENTPIEEEVALDPELLGKVFENLLASYNPETKTTARKQTGSFYTPREIVNYMVDESLIAYFTTKLSPAEDNLTEDDKKDIETNLRQLFEYNEQPHKFDNESVDFLINAIDKIKILDPAAGSGAFPMGILHRLVFLLHKLDPHNNKWKQKQIDKISEIEDPTVREEQLENVEESFENNELDYGRKLYLIENCIYGVDIQPIAVQIAKLRFFISLVVDQKVNREKKNFGIRPLPNLETKFVAANTLIGIDKPEQFALRNPEIDKKEKELSKIRERYFTARTHKTKEKYRKLDKQIRNELAVLLGKDGFESKTTQMLADWNPYDQNASSLFFDTEWMFGIKNGFDVVIGNPPYLGQKGNKEIFQKIKSFTLGHKYHQRRMDLFYFFFHFGILNLKKIGVLSFITTNYYLTATYSDKLRTHMMKTVTFLNFVNFNEFKVFESAAGQHNLITILQKGIINKHKTKIIQVEKDGVVKQSELQEILKHKASFAKTFYRDNDSIFEKNTNYIRINENSNLTSKGKIISILNKVKTQGVSLGDYFLVEQGIVSGADKVTEKHIQIYNNNLWKKDEGIYILTRSEIKNLNLNNEVYKTYIKPTYKNSNISKWYFNPPGELFVIYIKSYSDFPTYPKELTNHLDKFKLLLINRNIRKGRITIEQYKSFLDGKISLSYIMNAASMKLGNCYCLSYARNGIDTFEKLKIVNSRRAKSNIFALEDKNQYEQSDIVITTLKNNITNPFSIYYLLGLLNSKLYLLWFYYLGKRKGDTFELFQKPITETFIKIPTNREKVIIENIVKIIIYVKKSSVTLLFLFEQLLDILVFNLYFPAHMKEREIDILKYVEQDINKVMQSREFEELAVTEKEEVIEKLHTKWTRPDSIVRNRIKLMPIKSPDIIKPILDS